MNLTVEVNQNEKQSVYLDYQDSVARDNIGMFLSEMLVTG